jgi:hypothetical protein
VGDGFRAATAASFRAREVTRVASADSMPVSTSQLTRPLVESGEDFVVS